MGFLGILCLVASIFFAHGGAEVQQTQTPGYSLTANASYVEYDESFLQRSLNLGRAAAKQLSETRTVFVFSDMKNTLGIWGIFLFLIFNFSNGNVSREGAEKKNGSREGCGKSDICERACSVCDSYFDMRIECYELFIRHCFEIFNQSMSTLNANDFCKWKNIKSPYNNFTVCTEERADCLLIPWPNKLVEIMFVNIHSNYFKSCPTQGFDDPPPSIVFALVMTPICLIPVMVVLVVMKTKNGDRRS